jgi:hypothetical protein
VLEKLATCRTGGQDRPVERQGIESVTLVERSSIA